MSGKEVVEMDRKQQANKVPQIIAAVAVCFGSFLVGLGGTWSSPALAQISGDDCELNDCSFEEPLTDEQASWIGALFGIGCALSCLTVGPLMSRFGRKLAMLTMVVPAILGWCTLVIAAALTVEEGWIYYVARILLGMGSGGFSLAVPLYVSETAEVSIRGALGNLMQFMLTIGILFSNGVGALVSWEILTYISATFPVLLGFVLFFVPKTPYYLLQRGDEAGARHSLRLLRGRHYDIEDDLRGLEDRLKRQNEVGSISLKDFFTKRLYVLPSCIAVALHFFQQFSGVNAVLFYLTDIFEKANTGLDSGLSATLVAAVMVISTGVSVAMVERLGRRVLLTASAVGMVLSMGGLGAYFYLDENKCTDAAVCNDGIISQEKLDSLSWLPLVSLNVYIFAFSLGFGPLPWTMNGELFAPEAKDLASTAACVFNWICVFTVGKFAVNIESAIQLYGSYWLFGGISLLAAIFVVLVVPETKGKTAEDMIKFFSKEADKGNKT